MRPTDDWGSAEREVARCDEKLGLAFLGEYPCTITVLIRKTVDQTSVERTILRQLAFWRVWC